MRSQHAICSLAFSADGERLFAGDERKGIHVWAAATGRELAAYDHPKVSSSSWPEVLHLSPSADGRRVATVCQRRACVLDADSGDLLFAAPGARGYEGILDGVVLSPDGKRVLVNQGSRLLAFDVGRGKLLWSGDGAARAFSPDGALVAASKCRLVEARSGKVVRELAPARPQRSVTDAAFDREGRRLACRMSGQGVVLVFDCRTGRELGAHEVAGRGSFAFSPDLDRVANLSRDRPAVVPLAGGRARTFGAAGKHPVLSPDGATLAFADGAHVRLVACAPR